MKGEKMPPELNQAELVVIPKEGRDSLEVKNYRPISLLNGDVKLMAKTMATGISRFLPEIIHKDQTGFIPYRQAEDNVRRTLNIQYLVHKTNSPMCLLALDIEKAFNTVEWPYLFKVLDNFGFRGQFITLLRTYNEAPTAILRLPGDHRAQINIERGTKQGCPLSPLLFAMAMEPLAQLIRANREVQGLQGCTYLFESLGSEVEEPLRVRTQAAVLEVIVPPSKTSLIGSRVVLPCTFRVDNPPVNPQFLAVFWHFGNKELLRYDNKGTVASPEVSIDEKAAMNGDVSLTINNVTLSDEGTYTCLVIYSPDRLQKEIKLNLLGRPVARITRKFDLSDVNTVLLCSVTGFYPANIKVNWFNNGQVVGTSDLDTTQRNADGTFRVNSTVSLTPPETKNSPVIVCQLKHESLQDPVEEHFNVVYGDVPSVRIFSSKSHQDLGQIFVCEVRGLDPRLGKVNWLQNGRRIEMSKSNEDGRVTNESYYSLRPTSNGQLENVSCEVQHESLSSPIIETKQLKEKGKRSWGVTAVLLTMLFTAAVVVIIFLYLIFKKKYFQRFRVSHIRRPRMWNDDNDDNQATLYCAASDCEKDVQVTWTVTESDGNIVTISDSQSLEDEESGSLLSRDYIVKADRSMSEDLHNVITILSFTYNLSKHKTMTVCCKFNCGGKSKQEYYSWEDNLKKPEISDPIKLSLSDCGEVLCSVTLQRFYPKQINLTWSFGVGHYQELDKVSERFATNPDQTYNIRSECKIPGHLFKDPGFKVRVTWSHGSMGNSEHRELSILDKGFPWCPVIGEIANTDHFRHGTETNLQCKISGYFPDSLDVKWLKREAGKQELFLVSPSDKYKIPVLVTRREADNTFTCTACLIVTGSRQTEQGSEFICQVQHPSLERPLERSTGPLNVTGIPEIKKCTRLGEFIQIEVSGFYSEISIKWTQTNSKKKEYEEIPDNLITSELIPNTDGSYKLISTCKAKSKYRKAVVKHDAWIYPEERIFLMKKGKICHYSNGKEGGVLDKATPSDPTNVSDTNSTPRAVDPALQTQDQK
ncbi:uncharacterized protein O3C94_018992 [Discoglossus pictus]